MEFLKILISGISLGSIYAIIALGYTMVYGIAKMLNFAHGDVIMVGGYISFCVVRYLGMPGWVSVIAALAVVCFAFSTILGWGLYGSRSVEYLFGSKSVKVYIVIYCLVAIVGATVKLGVLWSIADTLNGLMAIPNLIAVAVLSHIVFRLTKEYFSGKRHELKA